MITLAWDLAATWRDIGAVFDMTVPELLEAARHTERIIREREPVT